MATMDAIGGGASGEALLGGPVRVITGMLQAMLSGGGPLQKIIELKKKEGHKQ